MQVTILDRALQRRLWGNGYQSITQIIKTVEITNTCPFCGKPRGKPVFRRYCEDGEWYEIQTWENPCGHVDMYDAVIEEARQLKLSQTATNGGDHD